VTDLLTRRIASVYAFAIKQPSRSRGLETPAAVRPLMRSQTRPRRFPLG